MTTPPQRKPKFFDLSDPEGPGLNPNRAATWLIDRLVDHVRARPDWLLGNAEATAVPVVLEVVAHQPGRSATIGFSGAGANGRLTLAPDGTGWLVATARLGEDAVFRAFIDQPLEHYELWPAGAADAEAPGQASKRLSWIQLRASAWPGLAPLAEAGLVTFECVEA